MSPRPSLIPTDADSTYSGYHTQQQSQQQDASTNQNYNNNNSNGTTNAGKTQNEPGRRAGACRVCLKSFKPDDYHKTCFECQQRVCEDCASYSKLEENEDAAKKL
uniref:FYVE-type zinc finger domain-containing protein n=1 Tax=Glossina brevipalpis TaxID=37001 RepID=A0A1A9WD29_9MUSC